MSMEMSKCSEGLVECLSTVGLDYALLRYVMIFFILLSFLKNICSGFGKYLLSVHR